MEIAKQLEDARELRSELGDTHGAISELNRTVKDMHQENREDLVRLIRAATPKSSPIREPLHISKRWNRRPAPKVVIHNGVKTEVVDLSTPTMTWERNIEERSEPAAEEMNNSHKEIKPEVVDPKKEVNGVNAFKVKDGMINIIARAKRHAYRGNEEGYQTPPGSYNTRKEKERRDSGSFEPGKDTILHRDTDHHREVDQKR